MNKGWVRNDPAFLLEQWLRQVAIHSRLIMLSKLPKSKIRSVTFYKSLAMQVISTRLP
jgi:hypothetical protein